MEDGEWLCALEPYAIFHPPFSILVIAVMIETATGIILRTRPFTETSLIVCWLTPESGRLSTVAKGARRTKSPFRGKLDLFYLADFSFSRSRRSELHTLREVSLRETHAALRQELGCLQQASYCAALIEQTTETGTPLPAVFELMKGLLDYIPRRPSQAQTLFAFELKLLNELGLKPDLAKNKLTPGAKQIVNALSTGDWPAVSRLKLSDAQTMELRQFLHGFLIYHLERIPGGRSAAIGS
jgi:DNA repair protein RecO (recombination protein O)